MDQQYQSYWPCLIISILSQFWCKIVNSSLMKHTCLAEYHIVCCWFSFIHCCFWVFINYYSYYSLILLWLQKLAFQDETVNPLLLFLCKETSKYLAHEIKFVEGLWMYEYVEKSMNVLNTLVIVYIKPCLQNHYHLIDIYEIKQVGV